VSKSGAIDSGRMYLAHKCFTDELPASISGKEPDVRQFDDWRFSRYLDD
jgi:hypothetical protein